MRKPDFCLCENKGADQLRSHCEADSAFVFATRIVQYLFFLNPKFQASSHLLCLFSSICVRPSRKPRRPVFARRGSYFQDRIFMDVRINLGSHHLCIIGWCPAQKQSISEMKVTKITLTSRSGWFWLPVFPILIFSELETSQ